MYGAYLPDPDDPQKKIRTQLLAWLDDHSRVILHAQFFFEAKLPNLEYCLRKAVQKFGLPKKIYVDNGQIYSAKHLAAICAHLGVRLMFARPYSPEGKGKIERFFGYVRLTKLSSPGWIWNTNTKNIQGSKLNPSKFSSPIRINCAIQERKSSKGPNSIFRFIWKS